MSNWLMGKIVLYSQLATARQALHELIPEGQLASTPAEAEQHAAAEAAVLVVDLAADEALEWLENIRIPLIALTAGTAIKKAECLPKPVRWRDLSRRLQRHLATAAQSFTVGPLVCDPLERILLTSEGEEAARLTEKEVQLLALLARQKQASRTDLLEKVWGYRDDLETHTLETHIYRLRQKLGDDAANPQILLTVEGGYALAE